jgi:1-deoxy-D-xylulose-5-phosphate reductoisomerase
MREICFSFRMVAGDLHDCPTTAFSGNRPDVSDAPSIRAVPQAEDQARPCQNVAVFGATGSIGTSTIDVLEHLNRVDDENEWRLWAASGHRNVELLMQLASRADAPPERLIVSDPGMAEVKIPGSDGIQVQIGPDALVAAAQADEVDIVVAAIVGRAGLESTLAAVRAGKRVALANKETLVVAGPVVSRAMETSGAELLPVDSEHSAIFQCIGSSVSPPKKLILTASGGPFRTWTTRQMEAATPESALAHPTWKMGPKITIDSATMMNKSLEIIEARWLFGLEADSIEVVVHPQSIIHSMVEFEDGSVIAQLSPPDMRLPIQYALTYPRRLPCETPPLDREKSWDLTLEVADRDRFPALDLGFEVAAAGGTAGAVLNAANEEAVGLFLNGQIRFTDIVSGCRDVLKSHSHESDPPLERLLDLDRWARAELRRRFRV